MKKLLALSAVLIALVLAETSDASTYVAVYKGTIKASNAVVNVNDTNSLFPLAVSGYWAMKIDDSNGEVVEANSVTYDAKKKYYRKAQNAIMAYPPTDPCNAKVFVFILEGDEGIAELMAVGKGKPTKVYDDPNLALRKYVPKTLTGGGLFVSYAPFDPNHAYNGAVTISMTLDTKITIQANSHPYNVDEIIDRVIVPQLTARNPGGWTNWPSTSMGID